ncbi:MAG: hypothetical protein H7Y20_11420, partial [Bryobacteraceae bacterium]|nr:hypothetical protein [Bryobacteraceae bacterium]
MSKVYVSYRPVENAGFFGRLKDRLGAAFGTEQIFVNAGEESIGQCDVLLILIAARWPEASLASERAASEREIAAALQSGVAIIPVLINEAGLPPALTGEGSQKPAMLREADFEQDSNTIVRRIQQATGGGRSAKRLVWMVVAAGIVIALVGSAAFLLNS